MKEAKHKRLQNILTDSSYVTIWKRQDHRDRNQIWELGGMGGGGGKGLTTKCHEETFGDDGNILHFGCGGDYGTIYICQSPSNCKTKHSEFYSM